MVLKFTLRLSLLLAASMLGGCYLMQAARGQLAVMTKRQPINKVIARPATTDTLKSQLIRALEIREFASRKLGLPDNAAYRSYADIGRPFVIWNVVATPEFSVQPLQWCFPIAGCVAYRGYFKERQARDFAAQLKAKGRDVITGGVAAYSTLGHIADPLLNTVIGYGQLDLAALVFHELAHQVAYFPGDSSYNEAFATAVEEAGVARYAAQLPDATLLQRWQQRRRMRVEVTMLIMSARADLKRIYAGSDAREVMRAAKARRFAELGAAIRALEQREGQTSGFGSWIDAGLNNAHLASVATYYDQVPYFEKLLHETCGDYLPCLYTNVKQEVAALQAANRSGRR
ncbi:MAG: aminopeptidase [Steroidobacteraceae bacterium]